MQRRWRVVATGPWEQLEWQKPLEDAGCEVVLGKSFDQFPGEVYSEQDLIDLLRDADVALVSTRDRITRQVLESSPRLKLVVKATIGVEKIDLEAAADLGIVVVNSPAPENYLGVAEATVGLAIMLVKRLQTAQRLLTEGKWKQRALMGTTVAGKTVGIIGLGRVGTNVARRLTAWDVRVVFYDPYVEPAVGHAVGAEKVELMDLLEISDVVTIHVALTDETRNMIDKDALGAMKSSACLINTARGEAIDEAALVSALEEGRIAGAALDVYAQEPLPLDSPLRRLEHENLILTPHSIGNSASSQATGIKIALDNIVAIMGGAEPLYVKNPVALPKWRARMATLSMHR